MDKFIVSMVGRLLFEPACRIHELLLRLEFLPTSDLIPILECVRILSHDRPPSSNRGVYIAAFEQVYKHFQHFLLARGRGQPLC
jgi:hypothetical protein